MRLTIDKPGLARALAHVASVVERRNTIPILSNVLLSAAKNELKLTATDLDMELVETVPCKAKGEGATTVPAHMFHDIVRKLPEGAEIELVRDGEQGRLSITSGPAQFSLQTLPADDFPALSVDDLGHNLPAAGRRPEAADRQDALRHLDRGDPLLSERHLSPCRAERRQDRCCARWRPTGTGSPRSSCRCPPAPRTCRA